LLIVGIHAREVHRGRAAHEVAQRTWELRAVFVRDEDRMLRIEFVNTASQRFDKVDVRVPDFGEIRLRRSDV
jgi:hypothetical protein